MEEPYISFVVIARNDNYGHRFLYRVQRYMENLIYLCEKYKLPAELIFVDWNPPKENKKLYEALRFKKNRDYVTLRFFEVPKKIHDAVKTSNKMELLEFPGKNAGMRKANGKFIVFTNPDIIFSEKMIKRFSKRNLKENIFYRADRCDMPIDLPDNLKVEELEKFCEKNWDHCWSARFGRYYRGVKVFSNLPRLIIRFLLKFTRSRAYLRYHGGSPGDFMILSKKAVEKFKGYPEINVHGGMDGYVSIYAIVSGNKLRILNEKTYHQSHGAVDNERPRPDARKYIKDAKEMLKTGKLILYNDENWGLKKYSLKETKL